MLFVDPTGMDNIIYLLVAGDFDRKKAQEVATQATEILKGLGLEIQVQLYDPSESGDFDPTKLDETDNWAVIGDDRKAIAGMARKIDKMGNKDRDDKGKSDYEYDLDEWENTKSGYPEVSNRNNKGKGIVVDYNDTFSPKDKKKSGALFVDHGAGHSSKEGAAHEGDGIMAEGRKLQREYQKYGYQYLFNKEYNQEYIQRMKERYSSEKAKDNYPKKKKK